MNIELHIDRLILDGVELDRWQLAALRAAVITELTRVLGEPAGWAGRVARTVPAGPVRLTAPVAPEAAGRAIAAALYTGLRRGAPQHSAR